MLAPIPGSNPGGENLRYSGIYDKIKEARREDDDAPQGDWTHELKKADFVLVVKLATDALTNKSKDLQVAAWLVEAWIDREGFPGLVEGLKLCKGLVENFWDNLYPEIEDGDAELRAAPLEWIGSRLDQRLKKVKITKNGLSFFDYKESRAIGYEADVATDEKRESREQAVAEHKTTGELWDAAVDATPKAFYVSATEALQASLDDIEALGQTCDAKFGEYRPSFTSLQESLAQIRQVINSLLAKKRIQEPDEAAPADETAAPAEEAQADAMAVGAGGAAVKRAPAARGSAQPTSREEALNNIVLAARFLRGENAYDPIPFLLLRAVRWGEIYNGGTALDVSLLEAPATESRKELRRLATESNWEAVIGEVEKAMETPGGRAWLDLQRYADEAFYNVGSYYEPVRNAVSAIFRALLTSYPDLLSATLNDDTPAAGPQTKQWIDETLKPTQAAASAPEPMAAEPSSAAAAGEPDVYDVALEYLRKKRVDEAVDLISHQIRHENSGRGRFQRQFQLAQICLMAGRDAVAANILNDLAHEIEQRNLGDWESPEMIAQVLAVFLKCIDKVNAPAETKERLYSTICKLDPGLAMKLGR
ncbi:MAG TPA: type VI secretion system protein TssA [Candidatus Koribacter sp.]